MAGFLPRQALAIKQMQVFVRLVEFPIIIQFPMGHTSFLNDLPATAKNRRVYFE
jgi:hypothetical protein